MKRKKEQKISDSSFEKNKKFPIRRSETCRTHSRKEPFSTLGKRNSIHFDGRKKNSPRTQITIQILFIFLSLGQVVWARS
jgi:hypothetical protein